MSDSQKPVSITNNALDLLLVQNISLTNKVTALRRQISDISSSKNEYDRKNITLETNFSLFKLYWIKHLQEIKSFKQLYQPINDQKEFEECLSTSQEVIESMIFQQSQEDFKEKIIQMFAVMSKTHQDLMINSEKILKETIFQQKLEEFSRSMEAIRQINRKIEENPYHVEVQELKKKTEKLEKELTDAKEYNEVLTRRLKISLKGFLEIDENLEKEMELGCICGGRMFDYLTVKNTKESQECTTLKKGAHSMQQELAKLEKYFKEMNIQEENKTLKESLLIQKIDEQKAENKPYENLEQAQRDFLKKSEEEAELAKRETEKFRKMAICPACMEREKSVILARCSHTFCRDCILANIEARKRKCPVCAMKFGMEDIKPLHLDI